jgi:gamma-tubulin complex component 2
MTLCITEADLATSLNNMAYRILPICEYYNTVAKFIDDRSSYEYGLVNHALAAAMRTIVQVFLSHLRNIWC